MLIDAEQLYIGRSNIPGSGRGLFTREAIDKDALIIEYTGKIRRWEEVRHDASNLYIYFVNEDYVIDAKNDPQSLARYANDANGLYSVKGIENNSVFVNLDNRIFIKATRNIAAHSEILVDYGEGYWDTVKKNKRT
jgi:uncharacterized protein